MSAPARRRRGGWHGQAPIYLTTPADASLEQARAWTIARGMTGPVICPLCDGHGRTHAPVYSGPDRPVPPREAWCSRCTGDDREPCVACGHTTAACLLAPEAHHCFRWVCLPCQGTGQRMAAHLWLLTQGLLIACARCQGHGRITDQHLHVGQRCTSCTGTGVVRIDREQPTALTGSADMRETQTAYWLQDKD